jgi:hypothetical protein
MGFFSRIRQNSKNALTSGMKIDEAFQYIETSLDEQELQTQLSFFVAFVAMILGLRILTTSRFQTLRGEHVLNIQNLNDAILIKEVFIAYLNAALLEPLLAIGRLDTKESDYTVKLLTNTFELFSLCWWIWLVTDAFDHNDVIVHYKYVLLFSQIDSDFFLCFDQVSLSLTI